MGIYPRMLRAFHTLRYNITVANLQDYLTRPNHSLVLGHKARRQLRRGPVYLSTLYVAKRIRVQCSHNLR